MSFTLNPTLFTCVGKSLELSEEENRRNRCKRKPGVECSPSEGPCCSKFCRFVPLYESALCHSEADCTHAAHCDGRQARCPEPEHKPDNVTECNKGTQVCQQGECKSSICLKHGLESCFLTSDRVQDKRELCQLACQVNFETTSL
jgi:disintegrin and metalloproteinase domain-containing protein 10